MPPPMQGVGINYLLNTFKIKKKTRVHKWESFVVYVSQSARMDAQGHC